MFSFENTEYLWGLLILLPLCALFILVIRRKEKIKKAIGDKALVEQLTKNYSGKWYRLKFIFILLSLLLGILAAANLRKPDKSSTEKRAGIDIMVALDVSKSMLSQDIKPTRLDRAKQLINLLVNRLGDNRIGLVLFAGQAIIQMPLTDDASAASMYVANASSQIVPLQGTNIASALMLCNESLKTNEKKYKAVILISDGEDHDPDAEKTAKELSKNGIVIYTVGIGSPAGSFIMDPATGENKKDIDGNLVVSKLNEEELKSIAKATDGAYFRLDNRNSAVADIGNDIDKMEKKIISSNTPANKNYEAFFPFFLIPMLLLLVLEIFTPEIKKSEN
jgi:Ca-activated chloride channel family protein